MWAGGLPNPENGEARIDGDNATAFAVTIDGNFTVGKLFDKDKTPSKMTAPFDVNTR